MTIPHLNSFNQLATLPLTKVPRDWFDRVINNPPRYAFGLDETHFHFRATRHAAFTVHPSAESGLFQAELWKFDVAEFFLRNPETGTYLEINLSPNGAWWSCLFTAPRQRLTDQEKPIPNVTATASHNTKKWDARISIPLEYLRKTLSFSPSSRLHSAFILDSPQRFLTTGTAPACEPNFHHPDLPAAINIDSPPRAS